MPNRAARLIAPATLALFAASPALAAPNVVASIKPIHSLVAAVMDGVGEPQLLVQGAASPHSFSLRPSDAAKLEAAEIVFWIGADMETFLPGPLASLASDAQVVELMDVEGMTVLDMREGGLFEPHSHDHGDHDHDHDHDHDYDHDHGHDHDEAHGHEVHDHDDHTHTHTHTHTHDHDHDHDHDHSHDHDHEHNDHDHHEHEHDDHGHGHHHDHGDAHIWLDTQNARLIVAAIADTLMAADPENAETYNENGQALVARLSELESEVAGSLDDARGKPFFVFHDAYHYFENRFDIEATGTFTVNPEVAPGAARLTEIRERVQAEEAVCLFAEPQFSPAVVETIAEGTDARLGVLDPLGADIEDGPELYFTLMRNLAKSLSDCLG